MLRFLCMRALPFSNGKWVMLDSVTALRFLRFYATPSSSLVSGSCHVSYLRNIYGLSPEIAFSVVSKVRVKNTKKWDLVLSFLKSHGLTMPQIAKLVRKHPIILASNTDKSLLPKINFLSSIGTSRADITKILTNSNLCFRSLKMHIIPMYTFLKSVVHDDKRVVSFLKNTTIRSEDVQKNVAPNIAFLREVGVPQSLITDFVANHSCCLYRKHDVFREHVNKILDIGFSPLRYIFNSALDIMCSMSKSTWERKVKVYKRWGLSENEVQQAFKKHPICMIISEKKIMTAMDFYINTMGCEPTAVVRSPNILFFKFENRIVPRCMVFRILALKGFVKKDLSMATIVQISDEKFMERFVRKYINDVPDLLSVYQGKMGIPVDSDAKILT